MIGERRGVRCEGKRAAVAALFRGGVSEIGRA